MNRRKLFKMLPAAGLAIAATSTTPEAEAHEVKPSKRYIVHVKARLRADQIDAIGAQLKRTGLDNVHLLFGDFDIYEIEK